MKALIFKAVIISVISLCKVDDCIKLPACRLFHHTWKRLLLKQLFHLFHIRFMGSDQVYQLVDKFIFFFMFMNINTCFFRKEQTETVFLVGDGHFSQPLFCKICKSCKSLLHFFCITGSAKQII